MGTVVPLPNPFFGKLFRVRVSNIINNQRHWVSGKVVILTD